ncbi:MAG: helix-turn-helix domain-containing protein [Lachnospiraceae bacterium]|nr:helix-turn-helix domain-containing protein [Lachnospiraceae bacterium]
MNTMKTELLKQVLNAHNIQPFVLLKDYSNLPQVDHELRMRLYEDFSYDDIIDSMKKELPPGRILLFQDEFQIHHFMIRIPEAFCQDYQTPFFLSGPFLERRYHAGEVRALMNRKKIPESMFRDLMEYYNGLPVVQVSEGWADYLKNIADGFFETDYQVIRMSEGGERFENRKLKECPKIAESAIEERYRMENLLLDYVRKGNYQEARKNFLMWKGSFFISPRTESQLRNEQNFSIILSTLLRKAAEQGGVPPVYIDELSSRLAVQINEARSIKELDELRMDMLHRYCLLVQNHSMKGNSPVVRNVVIYIDFHYAEDLSLNFFAERSNITKTYLSGLFKKEMGMTLTDYIHSVRMRQALVLIHTGSVPMSVVAASCGYHDLNYFIRMFKRIYGMTPKQYQQAVE